MLFEDFEEYIQLAQQRLDLIHQWCNNSSKPPQEILAETLSELAIFMEELHIVTEELEQQNEELRATRQALELKHQNYQDLFHLAPDGYLVTDTRGIIKEANYAIITKLGLYRDYLIGKPFIVFVSSTDRQAFHSQLNLAVQKGKVKYWTINLQSYRGKPFLAEIFITSQYSTQDNLVGLLWSIRDLSDRLSTAEQKICDSSSSISLNSSNIKH